MGSKQVIIKLQRYYKDEVNEKLQESWVTTQRSYNTGLEDVVTRK